MTDIDFDELDKAVNNLMGNVGKERTDDAPQEKTFNISSTLKPGEKPEYEKLGEAAKKIGNETLIAQGERTTVEDLHADEASQPQPESPPEMPPVVAEEEVKEEVKQPAAPAARRPSSGRFMDVVHPSSDMRTASTSAALVVPARETQEIAAPAPVAAPPVSTPEAATPTTSVPTDPAPLTPFLPDAKVEKRPLGGATSAASTATVPNSTGIAEETSTLGSIDEKKLSENTASPVSEDSQKSEFDNQKPVDATAVIIEQSTDEKRLQAIESEQTSGKVPEVSIETVESGDTESLSTTASSPNEQAVKATDEATGDIYNVKTSDKPLAHPAKQKSGWGTVIIIIVIIAVCAALGAAAYFILGIGL